MPESHTAIALTEKVAPPRARDYPFLIRREHVRRRVVADPDQTARREATRRHLPGLVKRREVFANPDALAGLVDLKQVASTIGLCQDDAVADVDGSHH